MESIKNLNTCDFIFRNKNESSKYKQNIENNGQNFNKLAQVITKKEYYIYRKILHMIDDCRIVWEDSGSTTIEIDLIIHDKLLQDVTRKSFIKKLGVQKLEEKVGRSYVVGNSFLSLKLYSGL